MKSGLKKLAWVAGLILAIPLGLFLIGFFGAMLGYYNPKKTDTDMPSTIVPATESTEPPEPARGHPPPDMHGSELCHGSHSTIVLPESIEAKDAVTWMSENRLIGIKNGAINVKFDNFCGLSAKDALTLHTLFEKARHAEDIKYSTPETEASKRLFYTVRMMVFAGASTLDPQERRNFSRGAGGVYPASVLTNNPPTGDFINLFEWHKTDTTGSAETAIRAYSQSFSDREIIRALTILGVITTPSSAASYNTNARWTIRTQTLSQLKPATLQAIHDAIKKTIRGDRSKLRRQIRKLIETRHTADTLHQPDLAE